MSVKHGLLAILDRRSMHGYELRRELADELGPDWALNFGQVYSTLDRLLRDGLVVQSETVASAAAPDRKLYTVTPSGRAELHRWFLAPLEGVEAGRDELYAKIMLALTGDLDVEQVTQAQRKGLLRVIATLTAEKERLDPDLDLAATLHIDLLIGRTDAFLRWLDTAEARIRRAAQTGASGLSARTGTRRVLVAPAEVDQKERT